MSDVPGDRGSLAAILGAAEDLGAAHAHELGHQIRHSALLAMAGLSDTDPLRYQVIATYEDSHDVALAEDDPANEWWPQPISRDHKLWLRSNLVNHSDLAGMLRVPVSRIHQAVQDGNWPEPAVDKPRKHWYWWPFIEPALAPGGLQLPPQAQTPPSGPVPSWWGDRTADQEEFIWYLRENLMDFARFADEYYLDRAKVLRAHRYPDYPEPVINRPGNYWYWWPDLDRFLVRHRDVLDRAPASRPGRRHSARSRDFPGSVYLGPGTGADNKQSRHTTSRGAASPARSQKRGGGNSAERPARPLS